MGHIGKLVKIAGGIMNTHSRQGDCRMELLAAAALRAGLPGKRAAALLDCNTTEDALQSLSAEREREGDGQSPGEDPCVSEDPRRKQRGT